jgi:hypothetical protein
MGLCTFLLILAPAAALLYVPLTMRKHELHPAPAVASQPAAAPLSVRGTNLCSFASTGGSDRRWHNAA